MSRTRRETAPTRAQQQASRPEYTLSIEKAKQVNHANTCGTVGRMRGEVNESDIRVRTLDSGTRGRGDHGVRGRGERRRRDERSITSRTQRFAVSDNLPRLPAASWELSIYTAQMQIFSMQ
eukprot:3313713-Pleurochrysis_carterae.AAC.1